MLPFHNMSLFYYKNISNDLPLNGLTFHEATPSHLMDEYVFFWVTTPKGGCVFFGLRNTFLSRSGQERSLVGERQSYNSMQRRSFHHWWCAWLSILMSSQGKLEKHDLLMLNFSNLKMAAKLCMIRLLPTLQPHHNAVFLCSLRSSFDLPEPSSSK